MLPTRTEKVADLFLTGLLACVIAFALSGAVFSEVTFDGSSVAKGSTASLPGPDYVIEAGMGTQKSANLFHSFRTFNVGTGETATFNDTGSTGPISNIIGRITGGSASSIDGGIISAIPEANLFLMNPYGFVFGPNATIEVSGAFHVTTADYLRFGDGAKFYADLGKASVLSTEPVAAFGFLTSPPASISIEGSKLFGFSALSFIGGNLEIKGDPDNAIPEGGAWIVAMGGQINLAALASSGEVVINQPGEAPYMDVSSFSAFGKISLSGNSLVDVGDPYIGELGAGTIIVRTGNLHMNGASFYAQTSGAAAARPVSVDIGLTGDMVMEQGSVIYSETGGYDHAGTGDGGSVIINAGNLQMQNQSYISTANVGSGNRGGNITINLSGNLSLLPSTVLLSTTVQGNGGDISIAARDISVVGDQASIDAGQAAAIAAQVCGEGHGGTIKLTADTLTLQSGAFISTSLRPLSEAEGGPTVPSGKGGDITIAAKDLTVSGMVIQSGTGVDVHSRIESRLVDTSSEAVGGNISVSGERVTLGGGGYLGTYLMGGSAGTAGDISVRAGTLTLDPLGKIESSSVLGAGTDTRSGNIAIDASRITLTGLGNGSTERIDFTGLRSDTLDGIGGDISIDASILSVCKGARIMSDSSGAGKGGTITLDVDTLELNEKAEISAQSTASGYAGNVTLTAGTLSMDSGIISTEARQTDGGDITIAASDIVYLLRSDITTSVNGGPETTGGNISIDPQYVVLNDSRVVANAYEGHGGNISIVADTFLPSPDSIVSASSQLGIDGTVDIRSPVADISGTLAPMRGGFLQSSDIVRDRCVARLQGAPQSSLTLSGRDGLPPRPGYALPASAF